LTPSHILPDISKTPQSKNLKHVQFASHDKSSFLKPLEEEVPDDRNHTLDETKQSIIRKLHLSPSKHGAARLPPLDRRKKTLPPLPLPPKPTDKQLMAGILA